MKKVTVFTALAFFVLAAGVAQSQQSTVPSDPEQNENGQPSPCLPSPDCISRAESAENTLRTTREALSSRESELADYRDRLSKQEQSAANQKLQLEQSRSTRNKDLKTFEEKKAEYAAQIEQLRSKLEAYRDALPKDISSISINKKTDDAIYLSVSLDQPGYTRIYLCLFVDDNCTKLSSRTQDLPFGQDLSFKIGKLTTGETYGVEIISLDLLKDESGLVASYKNNSRLKFKVEPPMNEPSVLVSATVKGPELIDIKVVTSKDIRIRLDCIPCNSDVATCPPLPVDANSPRFDEIGTAQGGTLISAGYPYSIKCPALEKQRYAIQWQAISVDSGRQVGSASDNTKIVETPEAGIPFNFQPNEPLSITFAPDQIEVQWTASLPPDSAEAKLLAGPAELASIPWHKVDGNHVRISIPNAALFAFRKAAGVNSTAPIRVKATMNHKGFSADQTVDFTYELKTSGEGGEKAKKSAQALLEMANRGKGKITWKQLVELGIPLILSFL